MRVVCWAEIGPRARSLMVVNNCLLKWSVTILSIWYEDDNVKSLNVLKNVCGKRYFFTRVDFYKRILLTRSRTVSAKGLENILDYKEECVQRRNSTNCGATLFCGGQWTHVNSCEILRPRKRLQGGSDCTTIGRLFQRLNTPNSLQHWEIKQKINTISNRSEDIDISLNKEIWLNLSERWAKVMSSWWALLKLWQRCCSLLLRRSTVGVHSATKSSPGTDEAAEVEGHGWGKEWKVPLTSTEQQLPCCCLKALEVCMQQTKLLSGTEKSRCSFFLFLAQ